MPESNPIKDLEKKIQRCKRIFSLFYRSLIGQHPVAVYQMGKVGSTTIYETIRQLNKNPVFHVHFLTKTEVERIYRRHLILLRLEQMYKATQINKEFSHITQSKAISDLVNTGWGLKWNIITAVRDPLECKLSHLFNSSFTYITNPQVFHKDLFDENGKVDKERALAFTSKWINEFNPETDYVCNWIDNEFKNYLGIDLYNYPFDQAKGYQIIHHKGNMILVLQMEAINSCLIRAIKEMKITSTDIKIKTANENLNKEFSEIYRYVKDNLVVSEEVLKKIYATKYVNHFYSSEFIRHKIDHWKEKKVGDYSA
jgi:hypothetical protein